MQNSITSLLNTMTSLYESKNNNASDLSFDDWLVQDALDDDGNAYSTSATSSSSSSSRSSPATTTAAGGTPSTLGPSGTLSRVVAPPSPPSQSTSRAGTSTATHPSPALHGLAAALIALMNSKVVPSSTPANATPPTSPPASAPLTAETTAGKATESPVLAAATSPAGTKRKASVAAAPPQRKPSLSGSETPEAAADEAALKRQKNTDAARRSRLKKVLKMEALEGQVSELEKTHAGLMMRVAVLDSEKAGLVSKEASYEDRIRKLEAQLAEAHKALAHKASSSSS